MEICRSEAGAADLSAGQRAIRKHVYRLLDRCPLNAEPSDGLISDLRHALAADPVVTSDSITGKRIDVFNWSRNYLHFLQEKGETSTRRRHFRAEGFIYGRGDELRDGAGAYELGKKYPTTASVLFSLARGEEISNWGLDLRVYCDHSIVTVGSGGNHRMLALMLWGGSCGWVEDVEFISAPEIASLRLHETFAFSDTLGSVVDIRRTADLEKMRWLMDTATPDERAIMELYFQRNPIGVRTFDESKSGPSQPILTVLRAHQGLKRLREFSKIKFWLPWTRERARKQLLRDEPILSWLELKTQESQK
jgi:hypothetical protein